MSLKVWLPLNGDLHNQGISNITITNSGATVDTAGKIGSCYSFVSGNKMQADFSINNFPWSVACWFYSTSSSASGHQYMVSMQANANSSSNFLFSLCLYQNRLTTRLSGTSYNSTDGAISQNVWYHGCTTYDGTNLKIYLNGNEVYNSNSVVAPTASTVLILGQRIGATGNYTGKLNDIRVYDHCLSAAEVREISQGLVLHYKLDSIDIKTGTNLVTSITKGGQTTLLTDGRIGVETSGTNADTYFTINLSESIVAGTSYFLSCDASGISAGQYWGFPLGSQNNSTLPFKIYNGHNEYTFTANDTLPNGNAMNWGTNRLFMDDNGRADWANKAQFYNFQLVKIGTGTELIVEDSSGYNHNGIITGALTLSSNTPRYSASSKFIAGSKISGTGFLTTQSPVFTLSYWLHMDGGTYTKWADTMSFTGSATFRQETSNTAGTSLGWYNYPIGTSNGTGGTTVTVGTWTHLAFSSDGTKFYFYKNGALYSTITMSGTAWTPNGNFTIGDNNNMFMSMSDFRIYATALTDDDIARLYKVGARVDDNGNIHGYEFVEGDSTKITKQGQVKANQVMEYPAVFQYDKQIYTESDGTKWAHIFHHNAPATNKFASTDTFTTIVYKNENMWFNFSACNYMNTYEFLCVSTRTASDTPFRCRWIQNKPPLVSTFEESKVANVTRITNGYDTCSYGGLYHVSGSSWLAANNGTNNNWFGATGCWTAWNNGIPGWRSNASGDAIKDGCIDIYVRIDNMTFNTKATQVGTWQANNFIEL